MVLLALAVELSGDAAGVSWRRQHVGLSQAAVAAAEVTDRLRTRRRSRSAGLDITHFAAGVAARIGGWTGRPARSGYLILAASFAQAYRDRALRERLLTRVADSAGPAASPTSPPGLQSG